MLAGVSIVWVVERIAEADLRINELIDKVVWWPRSLVLCLVATVIAAGVYVFERQNDRLAREL